MSKIDKLPTEILELIFKQLPSYIDIQNCAKTSVKWSQIIEKMIEREGKY